MSTYRREVEGLLGKECVTKLCYHVMGGKMSEDELKYFVQHLGELSNTNSEAPNVLYGNHMRRMSQNKDKLFDIELCEILSDWWGENLFEMTQSQALDILVVALSQPEVSARELAVQLYPDLALAIQLSLSQHKV